MSIDQDLRRAFERATLKREAKANLSPREWQKFRKIEETHEAQKKHEQQRYKLEYDSRVEIARKHLIDQAATKTKRFNLRWAGDDRFSKDAIERQAHRYVQHRHQRRLSAIDRKLQEQHDALLQKCERRLTQSEKLKADFARATNRRSGQDRRNQIAGEREAKAELKISRRLKP
jgi:hypothetical protein